MFKKRISAMLLAVLMVFALGACKVNPDGLNGEVLWFDMFGNEHVVKSTHHRPI